MAREVRQYSVKCPAGTSQATPQVTELAMPARTVRRIVVRIPPGPRGVVGFQVSMAGTQVIPLTSGEWVVADDEELAWDVEGLPNSGAWQVTMYNNGQYLHEVQYRFEVDPIGVETPALAVTAPIPAGAIEAAGAGALPAGGGGAAVSPLPPIPMPLVTPGGVSFLGPPIAAVPPSGTGEGGAGGPGYPGPPVTAPPPPAPPAWQDVVRDTFHLASVWDAQWLIHWCATLSMELGNPASVGPDVIPGKLTADELTTWALISAIARGDWQALSAPPVPLQTGASVVLDALMRGTLTPQPAPAPAVKPPAPAPRTGGVTIGRQVTGTQRRA